MLTLSELIHGPRPGPVLDEGECRIVQLPDGSAKPCNGLSDAERIWEEWEQERCEGK